MKASTESLSSLPGRLRVVSSVEGGVEREALSQKKKKRKKEKKRKQELEEVACAVLALEWLGRTCV